MEILLLVLGGIILLAVLIASIAVLRGWVLSILWAWFLVPMGLPPISIPYAIGISLVFGMLAKDSYSKSDDDDTREDTIKRLVGIYVAPLLILFIGWIVKQFL